MFGNWLLIVEIFTKIPWEGWMQVLLTDEYELGDDGEQSHQLSHLSVYRFIHLVLESSWIPWT